MRGTAAAFLLDPTGYVGGNIFDGNVPGFCAAQENHRFAVHESDIRQVQRNLSGIRIFQRQSLFQLGNVFTGELPAQVHPERFVVFSNCRDLKHGFL